MHRGEPTAIRGICPIGHPGRRSWRGLLGYGSAVGRVHEQASARGSDLAPSVDRGASTWSHGFGVALNSATIGPLLAGSDGATRQRLIASLQAQHGNAAVQRLLAGPGLAVQRWAVTLPRSTPTARSS